MSVIIDRNGLCEKLNNLLTTSESSKEFISITKFRIEKVCRDLLVLENFNFFQRIFRRFIAICAKAFIKAKIDAYEYSNLT